MHATVEQATRPPQVKRLDLRPRMAKAEVKKVDPEPRLLLARAIVRARSVVGWSQKEFAAAFHRDQALVNRWESGQDRPPLEEMLLHEALGLPLLKQLAGLVTAAEVEETMTIRRRA